MPVLMLRYQVDPRGVDEVLAAIADTFAALHAEQPAGLRYAYGRRADSDELLAVVELAPGVDNPLLAMPAARALQAAVARWAVGETPAPRPIELLGAYGFERDASHR